MHTHTHTRHTHTACFRAPGAPLILVILKELNVLIDLPHRFDDASCWKLSAVERTGKGSRQRKHRDAAHASTSTPGIKHGTHLDECKHTHTHRAHARSLSRAHRDEARDKPCRVALIPKEAREHYNVTNYRGPPPSPLPSPPLPSPPHLSCSPKTHGPPL